MKFSGGTLASILAVSASSIQAFSPAATRNFQPRVPKYVSPAAKSPSISHISSSSSRSTSTLRKMSDFDFPSAMPEKPQQTMEEKLRESATQFIADVSSRLGEGVEPPPELEALRAVRDDDAADVQALSLRIYELMIEQGMLYDRDPETGIMTPTLFDIKNNLDIPEVKAEFKHLYSYGMELIKRGMIDIETAKTVVKKRLIERTGLTPEKFDEWLGY